MSDSAHLVSGKFLTILKGALVFASTASYVLNLNVFSFSISLVLLILLLFAGLRRLHCLQKYVRQGLLSPQPFIFPLVGVVV